VQEDDATGEQGFQMLLAFYESTISLAGMQLLASPAKSGAMANPWEQNLPSAVFYPRPIPRRHRW
jgi:hypothetical protein